MPRPPVPISVVIPAYNAADFLADALASVAAQTVAPFEVIVVDDASVDETAEIAMRAGAHVVRLERNGGVAAARNAGIAIARAPWIAFLDADDLWHADKLAAQWRALERWPHAAFCFTDYDEIPVNAPVRPAQMLADPQYRAMAPTERDGDAVLLASPTLTGGIVRSLFVRQSGAVVRRETLLALGGYREDVALGEDYDLFLRVSASVPGVAVERPLVTYCRRPRSLSADPVAEIAAVDAMWEWILAAPERYGPVAIRAVHRQRGRSLRYGAMTAMRLGRFRDATPFARKAMRLEPSPSSCVVLVLTLLLRTSPGATVFRLLQSAWRARRRPISLQTPANS